MTTAATPTPAAPGATGPAPTSTPNNQPGAKPVVPTKGSATVVPTSGTPPAKQPAAPKQQITASNGDEAAAKLAAQGQPAADQLFEVKVAGEVRKVTKDELIKMASRGGYANKTQQQAKELIREAQLAKQQIEQRLADARGNPQEVLKALGIDPEAYAQQVLEAKIRESRMTPEERREAEFNAREEQLRAREEGLTQQEQQRKSAQDDQFVQRQNEAFTNEMADKLHAAANTVGLPLNAHNFDVLASVVKEAYELGMPFDAERFAEIAKEQIEGAFGDLRQRVAKGLKGKALVEQLGKEVVAEVLRYKLEELRGGNAPAPAPANDNVEPEQEAPRYITPAELAERNRERIRRLGGK